MYRFQVLLLLVLPVKIGETVCASTLVVWEGPTELLLAKVKNASGRIGIFWI